MAWKVEFSSKACKQKKKLPLRVQIRLALLSKEIEILGPIRKTWKNFSSLQKNKTIPSGSFHCHLKKGTPTYVACWRVLDRKNKNVEVFYVGSHEKAPY